MVSTVQVIINGVVTTLTYNPTSGAYEANITAPSKSSYNVNSGHYYPITVKATDDAGNTTTANDTDEDLGQSLRLVVKELNKPVITITNPTEGTLSNVNNPTINWTVTDDDSGVNPNSISIKIDNGNKITSGITKTQITGGYRCSYATSGLSDGSHTVYVDASDFDGNAAVQRTVSFTVDTVPPQLSITSPVNNLVTGSTTVTLTGTALDVTSTPAKVYVSVNGGAEQQITVDDNGAFTKALTLSEGVNTIIVRAVDNGGLQSTVSRTVTVDTGAPVIQSITLSKTTANAGEVIKISVVVTD